jgi:DNA-binding beta-propeller fold protein YncE
VLLCVIGLGFGVSLAWTPTVPDTILLPDSLGPLRLGNLLAFGSSTDNIYVASESSDILVVDGETFQRIKRINTGTPVGGALLVTQHNKLYCSYPQQGRIGVIDCASNTVTRTIEVGTRPTLLCYSSGSDKLYCGDTIDRTVTVIDCSADTVRKVIPVGKGLTAMVHDPTTNEVYAATQDAVRAISCSADSIVANIDAIRASRGLCINKRRQKLYAVGPPTNPPADTLYVMSTGTDSVIAKIPWGYEHPLRLVCNEVTDRLYSMDYYGDFTEYDCVGDSILRSKPLGGRPWLGVPCDTVRNRLYYLVNVAGRELVRTLDCSTLNVISQARVGKYPAILGLDLNRCRVMCGGSGLWYSDAVLAVFDCKYDSLDMIASVPLCGWQWGGDYATVCRNPVERKLYYRWGVAAGGVGVIDEQTNQVVRHVILPQVDGMAELAYSRTSNKLYCGSSPGVAVLDGRTDSVLKLVALDGGGAFRLTWCPDYNKLYCTGMDSPRWYMAVLDCNNDSVIKEIEFYDFPGHPIYLGNGRLLYLYGQHLALIDCRNDSVLVDTAFDGNIYAVAHTGDGEKIYTVHHYSYDRLEILDAGSLSLVATIDWPWRGTSGHEFLVCVDSCHKLYCFAPDPWLTEQDSVLVLDTRSDTVVARLSEGSGQRYGCLDHSGRYLFVPAVASDNSLIVYDTQHDSVVAVYEKLPGALTVVPNSEQRSVYAMCSDVILVYPDSPPGVEEAPSDAVRATKSGPSVVSGTLFLTEAAGFKPQAASLMDAMGRKALNLRPGENDIRVLAPGVYFVRGEPQAASFRPQAVRKVVIAK